MTGNHFYEVFDRMGYRTFEVQLEFMQTITCKHCGNTIDLDEALASTLETRIREQMENHRREQERRYAEREMQLQEKEKDFEAKRQRENELFLERVKRETEIQAQAREKLIRQQLDEEHKNRLEVLALENEEKAKKLKIYQEKELQLLRLQQQMQQLKEEEEFRLQKLRLDLESEMRERMGKELERQYLDKFDLERREYQKKVADQQAMLEEAQRKLTQGSMQMQGEVQELKLEEMLESSFPFDQVQEVGKGKRGADCILVVRNELGHPCGKIIFESKRTKDYKREWIPKLREDALEAQADVAVLVSQVVPEDIQSFDQRDGVWICRLNDMVPLVKVLREGLIQIARANRSRDNKGEKKEMLYNYFTSNEFLQQMRAINEAYLGLKSSIDRERLQMEKLWKEREKQIDRVLLNNTHLLGSIKGITGADLDETDSTPQIASSL